MQIYGVRVNKFIQRKFNYFWMLLFIQNVIAMYSISKTNQVVISWQVQETSHKTNVYTTFYLLLSELMYQLSTLTVCTFILQIKDLYN